MTTSNVSTHKQQRSHEPIPLWENASSESAVNAKHWQFADMPAFGIDANTIHLGADHTAWWEEFREFAYTAVKRSIDVLLSVAALLLLLPVIGLAAIAIKIHDGGPVLFTQFRVGQRGRTFKCFKFRSMILNAESLQNNLATQSEHTDPRTFKMANDPRITRPGRILRRLSIDELPQIFNVLVGDMSIVGPRPALPHEVALYPETDRLRLAVRPGLTCIWQVSGRSKLPFPTQVKLDLLYIRTKSLKQDMSIILRTIPAVLTGNGAS